MGTITVLDPHAEEIRIVLERLLAECEAGELIGAVIVTEKHDGYDLDMPGTFLNRARLHSIDYWQTSNSGPHVLQHGVAR
jgi:hypothetical protein